MFGDRRCRACAQSIDYGASPPPEPTQEEIFEALLGTQAVAVAGSPSAPAPSSLQPAPVAPRVTTVAPEVAPLAGLDTGRFAVGDVVVDEVPGLIDSTLFAAMTPDHVDVVPVAGLETTAVAAADIAAVSSGAAGSVPGLEHHHAAVGDVLLPPPSASVPGIYHSDMFDAGVDVAAGAASFGALLDTAPAPLRRRSADRARTSHELERLACPGCGAFHAMARCPSCSTAHPQDARS